MAFRPPSNENVIPYAQTRSQPIASVDLAEEQVQKKVKHFYDLAEAAVAASSHTRHVTPDLASYRSQRNRPIMAFRPPSNENVIPYAQTRSQPIASEDLAEERVQKKVKHFYDLAEAAVAANSMEASPAAVKYVRTYVRTKINKA